MWSSHIDPFVGIATLVVAIAVWLAQTWERATDKLPKRLSVSFVLEDEEIMRCDLAYMTDASAIRELGQTIGRQMLDPVDVRAMIPFCAPLIRLREREVCVIEGEGPVQHYSVVFKLTKRPATLAEGVRVVWSPPFLPENLINVHPDGSREVRTGADQRNPDR